MGHWTPFEVMTLDSTLETLANGGARDINKITLLENFIKKKALVKVEAIDGLKTELLKMAHGNGADLLEMTDFGFGQFAISDPSVTNLDGVVSIGGLSFDLGDDVAFFETHDSDRNNLSVGFEIAHHTQLGAHHSNACLHAHYHFPFPSSSHLSRERTWQWLPRN